MPLRIDLLVPANIRISKLDDIAINAPGEMAKNEDFCVFIQGSAPFGIKAGSAVGSGDEVNMRITISLPPDALDSAVGSIYTDTQTITVDLE